MALGLTLQPPLRISFRFLNLTNPLGDIRIEIKATKRLSSSRETYYSPGIGPAFSYLFKTHHIFQGCVHTAILRFLSLIITKYPNFIFKSRDFVV